MRTAEATLGDLETLAQADMAAQGAEAGEVRRTLRLRYDGADAELPVALSDAAAAKAAFEAAHQRLFGFVEPERTILIAAVEAEARAFPPLYGEGGERSETGGEVPILPDLTDPAPHFPTPTASPSAPPHKGEGKVRMFASAPGMTLPW
jgi:5-oxoprolinase (ATP-hydrolysing)